MEGFLGKRQPSEITSFLYKIFGLGGISPLPPLATPLNIIYPYLINDIVYSVFSYLPIEYSVIDINQS